MVALLGDGLKAARDASCAASGGLRLARTESFPFLLATLVVPIAWALPAPMLLDDAGSGADAGGSTQTAMSLAYGAYHANLTPGDADWFVFPAGATLGCMEARVLTSHAMRVGFGAGSATAIGSLSGGAFGTALAIGSVPPLLGALPDEEPWDAASVGPYSFSVGVNAATLVGDTNRDDASSTTGGALPVPGDCFRGHFRSDGSDIDLYSFEAGMGEVATYTVAQSGGAGSSAFVLDTSGAPLGDPVVPGEIGQVALPAAGRYYVGAISVAHDTSSTYALALAVGPEPSGCRPYCLGID